MPTIIDSKLAFGSAEPLPPKGFPPGRLRWRIRAKEFMRARVQTVDGIREFAVREENGYLVPAWEIGRNQTVTK